MVQHAVAVPALSHSRRLRIADAGRSNTTIELQSPTATPCHAPSGISTVRQELGRSAAAALMLSLSCGGSCAAAVALVRYGSLLMMVIVCEGRICGGVRHSPRGFRLIVGLSCASEAGGMRRFAPAPNRRRRRSLRRKSDSSHLVIPASDGRLVVSHRDLVLPQHTSPPTSGLPGSDVNVKTATNSRPDAVKRTL